MPAMVTSRAVAKGKSRQSSPREGRRMPRDAAPMTPMTQKSSVRSAIVNVLPCAARRSSARSRRRVAAPETMRKLSAASRVTVTSASMPPRALSSGRVDGAAHRHIHLRRGEMVEKGQRIGPGDVDLGEGA